MERRRTGKGKERKRGKKEKRRETRGKEWEVNVLPTLSIPEIRHPCQIRFHNRWQKNGLFTIGAKIFGVIL